ncbi:unnamed protein product [Mycena citricolor]|uniref:ATP-dependent RNA helicase n=1 Tax=Mycena citricolor TaxID=2018698 RepID=A0AAD2HFX1_9AGAR|nr:unnamed protein product [Mycena citricolor]
MFRAVTTASTSFAAPSNPLRSFLVRTLMSSSSRGPPSTAPQVRMPASRNHRRPRGPPYAKTAHSAAAVAVAPTAHEPVAVSSAPKDQTHVSGRTFASAPISEASKRGIKHEFMSDVQAATLDAGLSGIDLLVQAKTGTGKTLAFLLPSVERLAKMELAPRKISMLVLSPTRELALQIEAEAKTLIANHSFDVKHAIGGTNMNATGKRIMESPPRILIATPGRLIDHLENTGNFSHLFSDLRVIVYDEADRLLDQGFRRELDKIQSFLPNRSKVPRQALLFSATVSEEIKQVAKGALVANYQFLSTLRADEVNTHEHVPQQLFTTPFAQHVAATLGFLKQDQQVNPGASKAMVFLPTARSTSFFYEALSQLPSEKLPPLFQIHSRMSQSARIKAADQFKNAKQGVLFSSDVTARGMDFPGVSLVIQAGVPSNAEQYIHRLGRTARAGASGRGLLILDSAEEFFLRNKTISELGIKPVASSPSPDSPYHVSPADLAQLSATVSRGLLQVSDDVKAQTYRAWMGYYMGSAKSLRWSKEELVQRANAFVYEGLGWSGPELPTIERKTVGMMNLKGVPGLNIVASEPRPPRNQPRK